LLTVGPNKVGASPRDFTDTNGTYVNTGNPMNQDGDVTNGEFPEDRYVAQLAVNNNDDGDFIEAGYADFRGSSSPGRAPDNPSFNALIGAVEAGRLNALRLVAANFVDSLDEAKTLVTALYAKLHVTPAAGEVDAQAARIQAGTATLRDLEVEIL